MSSLQTEVAHDVSTNNSRTSAYSEKLWRVARDGWKPTPAAQPGVGKRWRWAPGSERPGRPLRVILRRVSSSNLVDQYGYQPPIAAQYLGPGQPAGLPMMQRQMFSVLGMQPMTF